MLKYLKDNADTAPHGPTTTAKALERSSGAVGYSFEAPRVPEDARPSVGFAG